MFNPAIVSKHIKDNFVDYISTTFPFANEAYNDAFRRELNESISKGVIVDIKDVFTSGRTIHSLQEDGTLSPRFDDLEAKKRKGGYKLTLPLTRSLYKHQERAIQVITSNHSNAVITTGTGSGKTECFLIPLINDLLREKDLASPGIRAILIYPMNALANDQMKRLRNLLMFFPDITFGVYNGETKYKDSEARAAYKEMHENEDVALLRTPLTNELISREKMLATPPHILCTNYAMLEHMLLRPENDTLFSNAQLKFIVLDEAHVYTGATGMETAFLLRRLKARLNLASSPQFILTSATLGNKGEAEADIISFAQNLTGEKFPSNSIVFGERDQFVADEVASRYDGEEFATNIAYLIDSIDALDDNVLPMDVALESINKCFIDAGVMYDPSLDCKANVYAFCKNSNLYNRLREFSCKPEELTTLASKLNISEEYLLYFLHLCSMALDGNGKSLIDVRYHFFLRALEGAFVSLVNTNQLFLTRKEHISDITSPTVFEIALCKNCGDMAIVGKIRENPNQKYNTLVHAEKYDDDETFFQFSSETTIDSSEIDMDTDELLENIDTIDDDDDSTLKKGKDIQLYYLCPNCGAILCEEDGEPECGCGSGFIKIKSIHHTSNCLKCYGGKYDRFYLGNEAATAVMATSLFEELPSRTISKKNDEGIPIDREGGKQFLSFSDSRSEAAFFASYLDKSHKVFLRRRGLISLIKKQSQLMIEEPYTLSEVVNNLTKIFVKNKTFIDKLGFDEEINSKKLRTDCARNAWIAVLTELTSSRNKDSLQGLGYLKFEYRGNDARVVDYFAQRYSIPKDVCKALLDELIMSFAYFGAINVDDDVLETEDRKYIFFTAQQKYFTLVKTGDKNNRYHSGWCARNRDGQPDKYYSNMRLKLVCKTLRSFSSDFTESQANELLEEYFRYIKEKAAKENRILRGSGELYSLPADSIIIRVEGDENIKTFKCSKCGKITSTNINNQCPIINCDGTLKEYSLDSDRKNNHYIRLYENENLDALIVKEHTAQLSREEGLRYQQEFEKNQIHSLSCSTTFEMGVDVGDLETVLLRNVPPSAANYAQRAGRAGRSKHAAAFALTYAKLSSHDFHYFKRPAELIVGRINPPVFKTDNDKILLRHIFAVVLSYFFKHLGYFEENHARKFLEEDGLSALRRMLEEKPKELTDILIHSFGENLDTQFGISNYLWADMLVGESNGILTNIVMEHNITVQQLNNKINEFRSMKTTEGDRGAYIASNRLEFYREKKIIDSFARGNVLPRYGFPVDTVELDVNSKIDKVSEKKYLQLSRDLKLAIGEYAPGERVVANGKLYTSRYIKKSLQGGKQDFHRVWVNQCQNRGCESWNVDHTFVSDKEPPKDLRCQACGSPLAGANWYASIEPRGGFASDGREEEVPMKRPEKVYTNEATYIGEVKSSIKMELSTGSKELYLISTENDRILITSKTVFYVCNMCGYSLGVLDKQLLNGLRDSKKKPLKASEIKTMKDYLMGGRVKFLSGITHSNERGYSCGCDMLKRHRLNHSYLTDIVTVSLPNVRFERNALVSAMYAILDSMSSLLQIPRTDIDGCVIYSKEAKGYNIILFDAVSGGAGHVKRLIMDNGNTLIQVMRSAVVKMKSCDCDTSCYKCLRSYYNQRIHDTLNRNDAVAVLSEYAFGLKYIKKYKVEASEE